MLLPAERRRQLGAFVRSRREALAPGPGGRRRTPGLRREEVALACGISTDWYSWIEQGRDIALSAQALGRLAQALQMTPAERAYLFGLALQRDPLPGAPSGPEPVPPDLAAVVEAVTAPAYLLDRLWTARAWNGAAGHLFGPWLGGGDPSLLGFVFRHPAARAFIVDWEERARRVIAEFRADTARVPDDPALGALVTELRADSVDFARLWDGHAVATRDGGARRFRHPEDGILAYEQVTLVPSAHPDHKIVMLLPSPATPS